MRAIEYSALQSCRHLSGGGGQAGRGGGRLWAEVDLQEMRGVRGGDEGGPPVLMQPPDN